MENARNDVRWADNSASPTTPEEFSLFLFACGTSDPPKWFPKSAGSEVQKFTVRSEHIFYPKIERICKRIFFSGVTRRIHLGCTRRPGRNKLFGRDKHSDSNKRFGRKNCI
uniref:(northern house mosquito) hypothetical protein n=1 Tax=Culex pipiens TaxID=7175 RepID=A0A8D8CSG6_CULPI